MWQEIESRIEENEREGHLPWREALWSVLRTSDLHPGEGATKKMVSFQFGNSDRLLWEIQKPATNVFLHHRWQPLVEQLGLDWQPRKFNQGMKDGGRHSALSRSWSFGDDDCIAISVDSADNLRRLVEALRGADTALILKPEAITRWIARLQDFFPDLDRFDRPDPDFDARERDYKLETARELRAGLEQARSDQEIADSVHTALARSNLLPWRAYWPMSPKGNADRASLWPALAKLIAAASGDPLDHPEALAAFSDVWVQSVPDGNSDSARQIAEFLFLHLNPDAGIYIRHTVRQDFWLEAVGSRFPDLPSTADVYRDELRFMRAVKRAFEERGLAPRDMIDVQSALWVAHNYKDEDHVDLGLQELLSREAIEQAMDAFDCWQKSREYDNIFSHFGAPKDYWVRSTRDRANRVFPTKPIIGFILTLKSKDLNGGWSQKSSAAALLYNSGYIIVDKDDKPVSPPEDFNHLIRDADRVRLCALNYYILPARESGEQQASILAGNLANDLLLGQRLRNVCQALKGSKFQDLAKVPPPTQSGVNDSTTTKFTYFLGSNMQANTANDAPQTKTPSTTNLILYGPPGTGKTYETAWEAVRLCCGDEVANARKGPENRSALMEEYRKLVADGLVTFVTFHQSMSYEEFVEGLRPETQNGDRQRLDGDAPESGGFRLKVEDGIFKLFSEEARKDPGEDGAQNRMDRRRRVVRFGLTGSNWREALDRAIKEGRVEWPYGGDIDWSAPEYEDWQSIKARRQQDDPDTLGNHPSVYGTWLWRAGAETGDYVLLTVGKARVVAVGQVNGEYEFRSASDETHVQHLRPVKWLWSNPDGADRASIYATDFTSFHPAYTLNEDALRWEGLEKLVFGENAAHNQPAGRPHVLIIDEINRANISKVFGELITLLEPDKRIGQPNEIRLALPYSKKSFGVPSNLHIVGTMNTADRSIALLDTALRRRFRFREVMPDPSVLPNNVDGIDLQKLLTRLNGHIEYLFDREHQIGHAYFTGCQSRADVESVMRDAIIPLLAEYFYEDWSKIAMVLEGSPIPEESNFEGHFLRGERLKPQGFESDAEDGRVRMRWRVKDSFDFSEFAAR
ncbi:AAA family ATPase [Leisingera daeponensis]|uniref:AAA family ATPase n=1 Tax=Leisingera daeponensis TaxID=405746 RepID=UPI001C98B977|nr:AAA family ATPase [Leisingera daeponensis]MBY6059333.1 AAA family ATPase [Leisingera daeponensis]